MKTSLLAFLIVLSFTSSAFADPAFCFPSRDKLVAFLARHGEKPAALGRIPPLHIMEIFASTTGAWSIVMTRLRGKSCVISYGFGYMYREIYKNKSKVPEKSA